MPALETLGLPPHVEQYLLSCNKQQRDQLAASLQDTQERKLLTAIEAVNNGKVKNGKIVLDAKKSKAGKKTKAGKKSPKKSLHATGNNHEDKAKRPLNGWMAFRAYYSPLFTSLQQKQISGFVSTMWQNDPFQAKWAITAKAYSKLRDAFGKDHAPLDRYFKIACPEIGIISPGQYMEMLGWEVSLSDGERKISRRFTPDISSFPEELRTTSLSADELAMRVCHSDYPKNFEDTYFNGEPFMAMAVHPTADPDIVNVAAQNNNGGNAPPQAQQPMAPMPAGQAVPNPPQAAVPMNFQVVNNNPQMANAAAAAGHNPNQTDDEPEETNNFPNPQSNGCAMRIGSFARNDLLANSFTDPSVRFPQYPLVDLNNRRQLGNSAGTSSQPTTSATTTNSNLDAGGNIEAEPEYSVQENYLECARDFLESGDMYPYNNQFNPDVSLDNFDFDLKNLQEFTVLDTDISDIIEDCNWDDLDYGGF